MHMKSLKPVHLSGKVKLSVVRSLCAGNAESSADKINGVAPSPKYSALDQGNIVTSVRNVSVSQKHNLFQYLTQDFAKFADKAALVNGVTHKSTSYKDLLRQSNNLSHFLATNGFQKNDIFGIHAANCPEYAAAMLGTLGSGCILSTANPLYTAKELIYQFNESGCKALYTTSSSLEKAKSVADAVSLKKLIVLDEHESSDRDVISLSEIVDGKPDPGELDIGNIDISSQVSFLPYSSGTTGLPKGVMLTHYNIMAQVEQLDAWFGKHQPDINLGLLPFFHIYGLIVIMALKLKVGKTIVTLPRFEPETFLNAIQSHKAQKVSMVPPLIVFLLKHPIVDTYDLSSIEHITLGAAPCDGSTINAFQRKFPGIRLFQQAYGTSETSPVNHCQPNATEDHVSGSVGVLLPSTQAKICCLETGKSLGPCEEGEIAIRGPQVMKGYLNNPEATARSLTEDGWYMTGDIAYYDHNHNFFIVDRLKELVKYKGFQVAPAELEAFLISHEEITDAGVVGIPDDVAGEVPLAFVVKAAGSSMTEEEVEAFVAENLSDHKRLRGGVVFLDALIKSPSGKILRRIMKDDYLSGKMKN